MGNYENRLQMCHSWAAADLKPLPISSLTVTVNLARSGACSYYYAETSSKQGEQRCLFRRQTQRCCSSQPETFTRNQRPAAKQSQHVLLPFAKTSPPNSEPFWGHLMVGSGHLVPNRRTELALEGLPRTEANAVQVPATPSAQRKQQPCLPFAGRAKLGPSAS